MKVGGLGAIALYLAKGALQRGCGQFVKQTNTLAVDNVHTHTHIQIYTSIYNIDKSAHSSPVLLSGLPEGAHYCDCHIFSFQGVPTHICACYCIIIVDGAPKATKNR